MNTLTLEKHCWAEIDLTALRENYEYIRRTVGGPVCAVVKADAYGHGDNVIARVLQEAGAAGFAVSSLGEGRHLRRGGITTPILILGYADPTYAAVLAANDLITTCYSTEYAQALSAAAVKAGVKVKVHLKIDTGMGRIGFAVRSGFAETIRELEASSPTTSATPTSSTRCSRRSWSGCVRTAAPSARYTAPTLPHSCATPSGGTT